MRTAACWPRWPAVLVLALATPAVAVELIGRLEHPALSEVSGIVKSDAGNFYWVHNDSGDDARLFAIDAAGAPLWPPYLRIAAAEDWEGHAIDGAWHFDWEDIALADGVLYIADVGNNGNARRDLGVYVVNEPDPRAIPKMRALKHLPVRYPDQRSFPAAVWHFDCEAVFAANGKLYFITKHRQPGKIDGWEAGAKLYRLDTAFTDRENVLTLVGRHSEVALATGADLSPDGSTLAISTYTALWLFDRPADGDNWFAGRARQLALDPQITRQLEAIAWDGPETLRLVNEQRDVFRVRVDEFRPAPAAESP